jgi:hypothetical protein
MSKVELDRTVRKAGSGGSRKKTDWICLEFAWTGKIQGVASWSIPAGTWKLNPGTAGSMGIRRRAFRSLQPPDRPARRPGILASAWNSLCSDEHPTGGFQTLYNPKLPAVHRCRRTWNTHSSEARMGDKGGKKDKDKAKKQDVAKHDQKDKKKADKQVKKV